MLGAADAGSQPDLDMMLVVSLKASGAALVADLASECSLTDPSSSITALLTPAFADPNTMDVVDGVNPLSGESVSRLPRTTEDTKYIPGNKGNRGSGYSNQTIQPGQASQP